MFAVLFEPKLDAILGQLAFVLVEKEMIIDGLRTHGQPSYHLAMPGRSQQEDALFVPFSLHSQQNQLLGKVHSLQISDALIDHLTDSQTSAHHQTKHRRVSHILDDCK